MKVLISGSSKGIGKAIALRFLNEGFDVVGLDLCSSTIDDHRYTHYVCDISKKETLPSIDDVNILINNAGLQNSSDDINNNLVGTINVTEKYGYLDSIKSILFNASASARSGDEFPYYVASKAGIVGYMRHVAIDLASKQVTVNSISLGGVITPSNDIVLKDPVLFQKIMDVTPMKKWMKESEVADWIYFLTVTNKSMSGEDLLIDNGEHSLNSTFVWPNK